MLWEKTTELVKMKSNFIVGLHEEEEEGEGNLLQISRPNKRMSLVGHFKLSFFDFSQDENLWNHVRWQMKGWHDSPRD